MIIKDTKGNELLEIIQVEETRAMNLYQPTNHALVVVKIGDDYLLGWNKWRKDWEIFGGCMACTCKNNRKDNDGGKLWWNSNMYVFKVENYLM